jgi:putative endonuclease
MVKGGAVYIMTNGNSTTLYVGVTSRLQARVYEHKNDVYPRSFTSRYKLYKLVYYHGYNTIDEAILVEKQIKGGSRKKKIELIESMNPEWLDLSADF